MRKPEILEHGGGDTGAEPEGGSSTVPTRERTRMPERPVQLHEGLAVDGSESGGNLVLIVSDGGTVIDVLDSPTDAESAYPPDPRGLPIDSLWPSELSQRVREDIRRTLRTRQVRNLRLRDEARYASYEFIIVAQGRDRVLLVVRDVSAIERERARLERLAYTDEPTGLPNLGWFLGTIERATQQLRLRSGRAAVICIEIVQYDAPGSSVGRARREAVLAELASRLVESLRGANRIELDDCDRSSWVARVDGHRFAVILPQIETGADASAVAARLTDTLEQPVTVGGAEQRVKVIAGIALYPQDGDSGVDLYESATTALEDARNSLSSQQRFHSGTVRMRALERQDLEFELKAALEKQEFALTYQPIVARGSREVVAAEALLRWLRPMAGSMPTREVIAAGDHTGLILPIGEWVFTSACRQLAEWHARGHRDLHVSVNVSPQEFARGNIVERTARILDETAVDASCVTLEITEHLLYRDAMSDFAVCAELKRLGVLISVDDYGTGICSFDNISRSPVDLVKIHEKFVAEVAANKTSRAACAAVVAMAHELGFDVVAEGIEEALQATALEEMGCDYLQGYLFAKPAAPDEFAEYLTAAAAAGRVGSRES